MYAICALLALAWTGATVRASGSIAPDVRSYALSYTTGVATLKLAIDLERSEVVFKTEPDFGGRRVVRGAIPCGPAGSGFIGFAWDEDRRELYLDQNRDLDLTDDSINPIPTAAARSSHYQQFEGLTFDLDAGSGPVRYVLGMTCYDWGSRKRCEASVCSGWQGDVELAGMPWRLTVVDNLDGTIGPGDSLFLRTVGEGTGSVFSSSSPEHLWACTDLAVNGEDYGLAFDLSGEDPTGALDVAVTPRGPATANVRIEGSYIRRIRMRGPCSALLEAPEGTVGVPPGEYDEVLVEVGEKGSSKSFYAELRPLRVKPGETTILRAGAPLQNKVKVRRWGGVLRLDYRLVDAAGASYSERQRTPGDKPGFIVRQGGKRIASGSFEYG